VPRYVIERQYLVPIYEHILVEAASLEAACREALDENAQPWGDDSEIDFDNARATTIAQAVELPEMLEPELCPDNADRYVLSDYLYCCGLDLLPIPRTFGELADAGDEEGIGFFLFGLHRSRVNSSRQRCGSRMR
jgi:hypothetical protein